MNAVRNGESRLEAEVSGEIRAVLARRKLSISHLAEQLGTSRDRLSNRVNGRTPLTIGELGEIGHALGMSVTELLARAETEYRSETA